MRKKLAGVGAAALLLALGAGVADPQENAPADVRKLTVEQAAIQVVQAPPASATNPLDVVAWVDHADNIYAQGERVRLFVQTNKDAYVTVLNVGPDGATTVLFPNRFQPDNRLRANAMTEVPDGASGAQIAVRGTTGVELIKVIASSRPTPLFEAAELAEAGAFQSVRVAADEMARNLSVVMAAEQAAEWDIYDKVIRTVSRRQPAVTSAPVAGATWPAPAFGLQIAADKPLYRTNDPVTLMVKTEADCYLTLLNTGPTGMARVLFPNRYQQQTLVLAGQTVVVPGIGAGVSIVPLGPAGVEHVTAVCRTGASPLGTPVDFATATFGRVDETATRNLAVVAAGADEQTAIASASFLVVQ